MLGLYYKYKHKYNSPLLTLSIVPYQFYVMRGFRINMF